MTIKLIWAEAREGVLGYAGTIPWKVPGEQKVFREYTLDSAVVMGRVTWESLPVRPLPRRGNIVLTRDESWSAPGAVVVRHPDDVRLASFWVIGGRQVYDLFLPRATLIVRTQIQLDVVGDIFAPELGPEWKVRDSAGPVVASNGVTYTVEELVK